MPATPVANGEHKADADAKAKAKAEALALKAAKDEALSALVPLEASALAASAEYVAADTARNEAHLALGFAVLAVETSGTLDVIGESIGDWSERVLPEVSGPSFGTSAAYRALQAARVAASIRGGVGGTSTDALRPMHRVKDVPGATSKVFSAAKAAAGRGKVVRKRHIDDALENLYPKDEETTPGPKKGTAKPKAASSPRNEPTKGVVEVPDLAVSGTRLKGAATRMTKVLADDAANAWSIAAATVQCVADFGLAATAEALKDAAVPTKAAAKPKAKATTPKATTTTKK